MDECKLGVVSVIPVVQVGVGDVVVDGIVLVMYDVGVVLELVNVGIVPVDHIVVCVVVVEGKLLVP